MNNKNDIAKLAYELTYHKYLLNKDKAQLLFTELDVSEYIALHEILKLGSKKTYLKDLVEDLGANIHSVSQKIGKLRDRGLVIWSHDGDGSDGTYVSITETGTQLIAEQEKKLNDYYSRVIEKFGPDKLADLLRQMEQLERIMDSEF